MNRIEKLIEEMCPEGVPTKKLNEFSEIGTGSRDKKDQNPGGRYPFYVRSKTVLRSDSYEFDETAIIIPGEGAIGEIFHFQKGPYSLHQRAYRVKPNSEHVEPKFLYFFMFASFRKHIISKAVSATVTSIRKPMIESFAVPIPPLEIQKEIVKILDKFTQLEAELEAELEAREKQYEEVRRRLLDFESDTSNHPLGEMIREMCPDGVETSLLQQLTIENLGGGTPDKSKPEFWDGDIPWASVGDINASKFGLRETRQKISDLGLNNSSTKLIPVGWVLVAVKISPGAARLSETQVAINQDIRAIKTHPSLDARFLIYLLSTKTFVGNGTIVKGITRSLLEKVQIPLPPLEIQKEIVRILDNLDSLVNSVNEGIPAEIAARRKQYEYYRDKLLTFKELDAG